MEKNDLIPELRFKAVRSSGAGGQNVNKVASKVELSFSIEDSQVLNQAQKDRLKQKLQSRLTKNNELLLYSDSSRSQHKNKELVIARFLSLIEEGLKERPVRKPTKVPKSSKLKRLKEKKIQSEKKANRQNPLS